MDPTEQIPLDPSRVVPYRRWSDPLIDNDGRSVPAAPEGEASSALWTAGLLSSDESQQNWLAGLVKEESSENNAPSHSNSQLVETEFLAPRRGWQNALDERPGGDDAESTVIGSSWLAGLVKDEKRPALGELARLLLGEQPSTITSDPRKPAPPKPEPDPILPQAAIPTEPAWPPPPPMGNQGSPAPTPFVLDNLGDIDDTSNTIAVDPRVMQSRMAKLDSKQPSLAKEPPVADVAPALPRGLESVETSQAVPEKPSVQQPPKPASQPSSAPLPGPVKPLADLQDFSQPDPPLRKPAPPAAEPKAKPAAAKPRIRRIPPRDKVSLYRALAAMFEAGVPIFAIFEFLSREGESRQVSEACRRIAQRLVSGIPLSAAAREEPALFDEKALRMLDVGYRGGQLNQILDQLAIDEEHAWRTMQGLRAQLTYPIGIALMTLAAVILMPPLVLTDLLEQVVALTAQPPLLTQMLLKVSALLASPWLWLCLALVGTGTTLWLRTPKGRALIENLELGVWFIPALGPLWRNLVAMRFLRVFAMTYKAGLPALVGMELATAATGSRMAYSVYPLMKRTLLDGGSLAESFGAGGFLPPLALEAIASGEAVGKVPTMLESASMILESEVQSRVEAVAKLVEPVVLAILGCVVGIFVLGCLLPIVELTANL